MPGMLSAPEGYNAHDWNRVESQGLQDYAIWEKIDGEQRLTRLFAGEKGLSGVLDLSGCTALIVLHCSGNELTSLNVSGCTALENLSCDENRLSSLDVSGCVSLDRLHCSSNELRTLDLSGCTALEYVDCSKNRLDSLELSSSTTLNYLSCYYNNLRSLDVSGCTALTYLSCEANLLTSLDVRSNTALTHFFCDGNFLRFSTLQTLPWTSYSYYSYSSQGDTIIAWSQESNKPFDFSSEYSIDGHITQFTWRYSNGTIVDSSLYTESEGVFVFHGLKEGDKIYCTMSNGKFPGLTLKTTPMSITVSIYDAHDWQVVESQNLHDYATWTKIDGQFRLTKISANNKGLTGSLDLSGCTALKYVYCHSNQLTSLNVSGCTDLAYVDCSRSQLTSLDVSGCAALTELLCYSNQLSSLSIDGCVSLVTLNCFSNQLSSLDLSGATSLVTLSCSSNRLSSLDISGCAALEKLDCSSNELKSLNASGRTALSYLACESNAMTSLNVAGCTSLVRLECNENELSSLDVTGLESLTRLSCDSNKLTSLKISGCTNLEYLSCDSNKLTSLNVANSTALKEFRCGFNELGSLDVSGCTALEYLSCGNNKLSSLDVSSCTALTDLRCAYNELSSLTVSNQGSLATLYCFSNKLTSLDLSGCATLTLLYCTENQLTSLNLTGCTSLSILYCYSNRLSSLNVTGNTALTKLYCDRNDLRSLDVSGCTALETLNCERNYEMSSLNVSGCTSLTSLSCAINKLTALDLSECTALTGLGCDSNSLTSLDLSNNTALVSLSCSLNALTSLDLTNCTSLSRLTCYSNQLTSLEFPPGAALTYVDCSENLLTSLDLSGFTSLGHLNCSENLLASLDISGCTSLVALSVENNALTSLDLTSNTALQRVYCAFNELSELDLTSNTALTSFYCNDNKLRFSTLRTLPPTAYTDSTYAPQGEIAVTLPEGEVKLEDLAAEYLIDGHVTQYTWRYADGTVVDPSRYTETDGVFVFTGLPSGARVYCTMTNAGFPLWTLRTNNITVHVPLERLDSPVPLVTDVNHNEISLEWDAVPNAVRYTIQYTTDAAFTNGLVTKTVTKNATKLTPLTQGTTYYIRVMASNADSYEDSDYSQAVSTTTKTKLLTPTIKDITTIGLDTISVEWDGVENAEAYQIQYSTNAVFISGLVTMTVSTNSLTLSDLNSNTTYFIRVAAIGAGPYCDSDVSATKSAKTKIKLDTPTLEKATPLGHDRIELTWTAVPHAEEYLLEYACDGEFFDAKSITVTSVTSAILADLTPDTTYFVRVTAKGLGAYCDSDDSEVKSVTTQSELNRPTAIILNAESLCVQEGCWLPIFAGGVDPLGQGLTYAWDLIGNGEFVEYASGSAEFSTNMLSQNPGKWHTVRLKVRDAEGIESEIVEANISIENLAPTFLIQSPDAADLFVGEMLYWDILAKVQPFSSIMNWSIDWGDGSPDTEILGGPRNRISVAHLYRQGGEYPLTVTTMDINGLTASVVIGTYAIVEERPSMTTILQTVQTQETPTQRSASFDSQNVESSLALDFSTQDLRISQWSQNVKTLQTTRRHMIDLDQRSDAMEKFAATTDYLLSCENFYTEDFFAQRSEENSDSSPTVKRTEEVFANIFQKD